MPNQALNGFVQILHSFIRDPSLSRVHKLVGIVLASHANRERLAWPSLKCLSLETGYGKDVLCRARQELVGLGYLRRVHVRGDHGKFQGRLRFEVTDRIIHIPKRPESGSSPHSD